MMKSLVLIACASICLVQTATAASADTLVAEGRSFLASRDLTNAHARFGSALAVAPNHEKANFFYAATRLLTLADTPGGEAVLNRFGFAATNRNLFAWTALPPLDTNNIPHAPAGSSSAEAIGFLRTNALAEVMGAAANLANITSPGFSILLTENETSASKVTVDYGDVVMLRAGLLLAQYAIYTVNTWNLDVQLDVLRSLVIEGTTAEELLRRYPQAFTFRDTTDLLAARQAFSNASTLYAQASNLIRARPATAIRLFNLDAESVADELAFRTTLNELKQSLNGPVILSVHPQASAHFARHFAGTVPPRAFLPKVAGNAFVAGTLPDPTFDGLLEGVSRGALENLLGQRSGLGVPVVSALTLPTRLPDGRFMFSLTALNGTLLAIQTSTDLQTWATVDIMSATNGGAVVVDDAAPGAAVRYYRALDLSREVPENFRPHHDDFAQRVALTGGNFSVVSTTTGATREPDEPEHAGIWEGGTIWWSWTAPSSGPFALDTFGSDRYAFLAVYEGDAFGNLSEIPNDFWPTYFEFSAVAGTTYQIAVTSYLSFGGKVVLNLRALPPNNHYEDRFLITGLTNTVTGHNVNATPQWREPDHAGQDAWRSVWWTWTAPADGIVTIDTFGSSFDTLLAVYSDIHFWGELFGLVEIASNDDFGTELTSQVSFPAVAGIAYDIAVDGFAGGTGDIVLHLRHEPLPPPVNDNFTNATPISGTNLSVMGSNLGGTAEPGEPGYPTPGGGTISPIRTVWWRWTASMDGDVFIDTAGSDFENLFAVHIGDSVSNLTTIGRSDSFSPLIFSTTAGATYHIAVDSYGEAGNILLNLQQTEAPLVPPQVFITPYPQVRPIGTSMAIAAYVNGSFPMSFQWLKNGSVIPGANSLTYRINSAQTTDAGRYSLLASNAAGTAVSSDIQVAIVPTNVVFLRSVFAYADTEYSLSPVFGPGNWRNLRYESANVASVFSSDTPFVYMEGTDYGATEMEAFLSANLNTIQNWVSNGGRLLLNAAPYEDNGMNLGFGVNLVYSDPTSDGIPADAEHPVFGGPFAPVDSGWNNFGTATVNGPGLAPIVINSNNGRIVLAEKHYGAGLVLFGGMTSDQSQWPSLPASNLRRNILVYGATADVCTNCPPLIVKQPLNQTVWLGMPATFTAKASGTLPLHYQWRKDGISIPGATGASYAIASTTTNHSGAHDVVATNAFGSATSLMAMLEVTVPPPGDTFRINALLTSNSQVVDHNSLTGDDRGGIAVSTSRVFYTGDSSTARFALTDLSGGVALNRVFDALVSDLKTSTVYSLGNGINPLTSVGGNVTTLLGHDPTTGLLNGSSIPLSTFITLPGSNVGIFAGYGRVVLHSGTRVYDIRVPSGIVTDLGAMAPPSHIPSENWAYWGVAESVSNVISLVCVQDYQTITRTAVPSGITSTVATFSNLADMAAFTVSVPLGRWYFHYEGGSQFGGFSETIGYADATFSVSP